MEIKTATPMPALPAGLKITDTHRCVNWKQRDYESDFELWHVASFGWVIPTLTIRQVSRHDTRHQQRRSYAVTMDGKLVRVGFGPHVTHMLEIIGRKSRKAALQPFLKLRTDGEALAGTVRDRISTRRAQGTLRRTTNRWF